MEIDEAETLELVGVLVYSSIAQVPVSGELSQFQLTLYCPGEDNTDWSMGGVLPFLQGTRVRAAQPLMHVRKKKKKDEQKKIFKMFS